MEFTRDLFAARVWNIFLIFLHIKGCAIREKRNCPQTTNGYNPRRRNLKKRGLEKTIEKPAERLRKIQKGKLMLNHRYSGIAVILPAVLVLSSCSVDKSAHTGSTAVSLPLIPKGIASRAISWENRDGAAGKGGMAAGKLGAGRKGSPCTGQIKNGDRLTLMDVAGCGVIRHIWMTLPDRDPIAYRNLILRMYWDHSEVPSVEVPVGDFFGMSHGIAVDINSAMISAVKGKGLNSWFAMPFHEHAKITIENDMPDGRDLALVFFQIDYELHERLPDNIGLFHAQFRRENPTVLKRDFVILDNVQGPGYFAGCIIGVRTLGGHWWGEGEMKFYMDGDTDFPTICGTGTEDYFGNAWGMDLFQTPYLGCTLMQRLPENSEGLELISMYRFHVPDPVYFQKELKATIQQIGWFEDGLGERSDDWCSVAYWYQAAPVKQMPPLPDKVRRSAGIVPDKGGKNATGGQWTN
jgi:hypothetical protein